MICPSVKRFFMSNLLSMGSGSKATCYLNTGRRRPSIKLKILPFRVPNKPGPITFIARIKNSNFRIAIAMSVEVCFEIARN